MGRAASWNLIGILAMSLAAIAPALAADESARFQVRGEIRPQPLKEDGRFVLKAINVPEAGCDPLLELFADGFEGT
jgi:hypothetical protein